MQCHWHCPLIASLSPAFASLPQAAVKSARIVVDRLLDREKENNGGQWPESIALVLWGTDNIKTYGESLAQVSISWQRKAAVSISVRLDSTSTALEAYTHAWHKMAATSDCWSWRPGEWADLTHSHMQ